jgi:hypothetical protein
MKKRSSALVASLLLVGGLAVAWLITPKWLKSGDHVSE